MTHVNLLLVSFVMSSSSHCFLILHLGMCHMAPSYWLICTPTTLSLHELRGVLSHCCNATLGIATSSTTSWHLSTLATSPSWTLCHVSSHHWSVQAITSLASHIICNNATFYHVSFFPPYLALMCVLGSNSDFSLGIPCQLFSSSLCHILLVSN